MSTQLEKTKSRLSQLGVEPDRALGQNFLISEGVIQKIIGAARDLKPRFLLEIGPGVGALTDHLRLFDVPLTLVELDRDFAKYWRDQGAQVIEADALKADWDQLANHEGTVLVSNLPYQISTHLVIDRCLGPAALGSMVLMFQKEVAERLMARPRSSAYGLLSVMAQSFFKVERLLEAGTKDFWPAPKIASQVLIFRRMKSPLPGREEAFLKFLKAAFAQRRKFLSKNLQSIPMAKGMNREFIEKTMEEMNINVKVRAEELSVTQFQELFLKMVKS